MKLVKFSSLIAAGLLVCGVASAADDHAGNNMSHGDEHNTHSGMNKMSGMFLEKRDIDGYTVSFHVMPKNEAMDMGGTHNLMVKVEKGGHMVDGLKINSKVVHPNDKSQTKALMKMGDWYMAGYDLGHAGRHQLMVLFKTADGEKHRGGVFYPEK